MLPERLKNFFLCLQIKISFIKKNFICKEKRGTATKVKLVRKVKKHNQLFFDFGVVIAEIATTWRLKKSQNNDKLS